MWGRRASDRTQSQARARQGGAASLPLPLLDGVSAGRGTAPTKLAASGVTV